QRADHVGAAAQCRAVGVVGRRDHLRVMFGADLAAAADDAAGKRQNHAADAAHRIRRRLGGRERRPVIARENQQIAAADRPLDAKALLNQELAVHHRDAPVAAAVEKLARLVLVAEVTQQAADRNALLTVRQTVEARGGRTRQDALTDAVDEALTETG